jgi:hypothetical protein
LKIGRLPGSLSAHDPRGLGRSSTKHHEPALSLHTKILASARSCSVFTGRKASKNHANINRRLLARRKICLRGFWHQAGESALADSWTDSIDPLRPESYGGLMSAQNVAQDAKHDQNAGQQERNQLQILLNVQSDFADVLVRPQVMKSTLSLVAAMSNPSDQG